MKYNEYIAQLPYMCVPAVLQMVFARRNLDIEFSQIEIASCLDFKNSPNSAKFYPDFPVELSPDKQGCRISDLNSQLFLKKNIPLREIYLDKKIIFNYLKISRLSFKEFLKQVFTDQNDIVIALDHAILFSIENVYRHVCLLDHLYDNTAVLVVPSDRTGTKTEEHKYSSIELALKECFGGSIWIIDTDKKINEYNYIKEMRLLNEQKARL